MKLYLLSLLMATSLCTFNLNYMIFMNDLGLTHNDTTPENALNTLLTHIPLLDVSKENIFTSDE